MASFQFNRTHVEVVHGDITEETTHCIINSSNDTLDLNLGMVSKVLLKKGGDNLKKACEAARDEMKKNGLVFTKSGNLRCKYILHIQAPDSDIGWFLILKKSFDRIAGTPFKSLSIPALGTGDMHCSAQTMADLLAETIKKVAFCNSTNLELIRVVIFEENLISVFKQAFSDEVDSPSDSDYGYSTSEQHKTVPEEFLDNQEIPLIKEEKECLAGNKTIVLKLKSERFFTNSPQEFHYRIAESQFYRKIGCVAEMFDIDFVNYVVNPIQRKKFREAQKHLRSIRGEENAYPVLAFHGTTLERANSICVKGFLKPGDAGFQITTDYGYFGAGVYLSGYAGYSMPYALESNPPVLILCQVLLGKVYRCPGRMNGKPVKPGYDSHISPKGKELIIFNTDHILPLYVIHCKQRPEEPVVIERE